MYTDTEGIVFKQIKTVNGRRMIVLFSKKYGKISAGTGASEKGRGKSALAIRPFTYGRYELFKNKDSYNINGAEVIKSYYNIGENVEKYMSCSYILEFTERLLFEDEPLPNLFSLLTDFFQVMETRKKRFETIVLAYQWKALKICGHMPNLNSCVLCGSKQEFQVFDVKEGGLVCGACTVLDRKNDGLIYEISFGIVDILRYFLENPLSRLEKLALDEDVEQLLRQIIKSYIAYHLDIRDLKSEEFLFV